MFLTNFSSGIDGRPSFFEMLAQQELMTYIRPAIRYSLAILSQRHPRLIWFALHSDEIFAGFSLLLEHHHLKYYDASFSEHFYGLIRVKTLSNRENVNGVEKPKHEGPSNLIPISTRDRNVALLFLVILPYLKAKMDQWYTSIAPSRVFNLSNMQTDRWIPSPSVPENPSSILPSTSAATETTRITNASLESLQVSVGIERLKRRIRLFFRNLYPFLNAFYEGSFFLYHLLYLYNRCNYFTPLYHLERIQMSRMSLLQMDTQNLKVMKQRHDRWRSLTGGGPLIALWKYFSHYYDDILDYSQYILPISIFLYKFLEWFYTENRLSANTALPTPPPPEPPKRIGLELPVVRGHCAICKRPRTNSALCCTSGFAFCYPCLFHYVSHHKKCPITHLPTEIDQIRKIYENR